MPATPTTGGSRYVTALREWDQKSASYKDTIVPESSLKKDQPKNMAYLFRRVIHDTHSADRQAYSEIEIEGPRAHHAAQVRHRQQVPQRQL